MNDRPSFHASLRAVLRAPFARAAVSTSLLGGVVTIAACSAGDTSRAANAGEPTASASSDLETASIPKLPKHVFRWSEDVARATALREASPLALLDDANEAELRFDRPGYPAFHPDVPHLIENGGPTLKHPHIVSITWDGDPDRDTIESFGDKLGGSRYWAKAVGEYGVGATWSGDASHVHLSPMPTSAVPIRDLFKMIRTNVATAPKSGWPQPDAETMYVVYMPPNIGVSFGDQDICQSNVGGWHEDTAIDPTADGGSAEFLYALIFRCPRFHTGADATEIASHEIAESATDPYPNTSPGLVGYDPNHLAYEFTQQYNDENGDACEFFPTSKEVESSPFEFEVQRPWSNRLAREGHNPCAPLQHAAYFNTTTFVEEKDEITLDLTAIGGAAGTKTKGFKVPLGQSRTFHVGFFSDAPTDSEWTLSAITSANPGWSHLGYLTDANGNPVDNGAVTVTIDKPTGKNGHIARVTVTANKAGAVGGEWLVLRSLLPGMTSDPARPMLNDLPILIGQQ